MGGYGTERSDQAAAILAQDALVVALGDWVDYDDAEGAKWRSVFGTDEKMPDDSQVTNDEVDSDCDTCEPHIGHAEWLVRFGENALRSQYQDGHFAYAVIPGGGSGTSAFPPVLYVVDIENASNFNNVIEP